MCIGYVLTCALIVASCAASPSKPGINAEGDVQFQLLLEDCVRENLSIDEVVARLEKQPIADSRNEGPWQAFEYELDSAYYDQKDVMCGLTYQSMLVWDRGTDQLPSQMVGLCWGKDGNPRIVFLRFKSP